MLGFGNNAPSDNLTDQFFGTGKVPLSEEMIKRDNFFHSCWMLLKRNRPDLMEDMQRCELILSGYNPDAEKEDAEETTDSKEQKRITL